jgi:hypothetical protein
MKETSIERGARKDVDFHIKFSLKLEFLYIHLTSGEDTSSVIEQQTIPHDRFIINLFAFDMKRIPHCD